MPRHSSMTPTRLQGVLHKGLRSQPLQQKARVRGLLLVYPFPVALGNANGLQRRGRAHWHILACVRMRKTNIRQLLTGGSPRSLGRGEQVVKLVLANPKRVRELFECILCDDVIVRMRASDALEKVCRQKPLLLQPLTERLFTEVASIKQPSVQWHLSQILGEIPLNNADTARAIRLLKRTLSESTDWIVINLTLESLARFASEDQDLRSELKQLLPRYLNSPYKSVAARARRLARQLESLQV